MKQTSWLSGLSIPTGGITSRAPAAALGGGRGTRAGRGLGGRAGSDAGGGGGGGEYGRNNSSGRRTAHVAAGRSPFGGAATMPQRVAVVRGLGVVQHQPLFLSGIDQAGRDVHVRLRRTSGT